MAQKELKDHWKDESFLPVQNYPCPAPQKGRATQAAWYKPELLLCCDFCASFE